MKKGLKLIIMTFSSQFDCSNYALMKKGLKRVAPVSTIKGSSFELRPDEEGIETFRNSILLSICRSSNYALMKKGLKPLPLSHCKIKYKFELRPDEEGIETTDKEHIIASEESFELRPDEEGIETLA